MSPLLIILLGVTLLPVFVGRWRMSLLGLSLQGLLMGWIAWLLEPSLESPGDWLRLTDLLLVRGLFAPLVLYRVLKPRQGPGRTDALPANLLFWTVALGAVMLAFNVSATLVPLHGDQQTLVSVAMASLLLGFLVLATRALPFSQMVGALRLENAIALFELSGPKRSESLALQFGQLVILIVTVGLFRWYLVGLGPSDAPVSAPQPEGPAL